MMHDNDDGLDLGGPVDFSDEPTELEPTAEMQRDFVMHLVDQLRDQVQDARRRIFSSQVRHLDPDTYVSAREAEKTVDLLETKLRWLFNRCG